MPHVMRHISLLYASASDAPTLSTVYPVSGSILG